MTFPLWYWHMIGALRLRVWAVHQRLRRMERQSWNRASRMSCTVAWLTHRNWKQWMLVKSLEATVGYP